MKYILQITFLSILIFGIHSSDAQFTRIDSTLKIGRVGYRVNCNNKRAEQNELTIKLLGFDNSARDVKFYVKGRVVKGEIDDLNNDGFPDLILYLHSGINGEFGSVLAFVSEANKSVAPFGLPDPMLDGKIKDGYKGHDEFTLIEGQIMQKFPLYKPGDDPSKPTGGNRVVVYKVASENGGYQFKMVRFYDLK